MPLNGRVECIDWCIHRLVAGLNGSGVRTISSCCGHGVMPGQIALDDGRVLVIYPDWSEPSRLLVRTDSTRVAIG